MNLKIKLLYVPIVQRGILVIKDVEYDKSKMKELEKLSAEGWEVKAATPIADSVGQTRGISYTLQQPQ